MGFFYLRQYLRTSLWFLPVLAVIAAITLGLVFTAIDQRIHARWAEQVAFERDPENARTFLSMIGASMITLTGLVFTITIVVLQLASQQFSPRLLRTFLKDAQSRVALATFIATFAYAVVVLREIRSAGDRGDPVPSISMIVAFALVLFSLAVFVSYIDHISQSIRIAKIAQEVGDETRAAIDRIYDHPYEDPVERPQRGPVQVIPSPRPGVVTALDRDALADVASRADAVLEVVPLVGDFVPEGAPLVRVYGDDPIDDDEVVRHVALGPERTMEQDPAFGFRQLVDIAEKALSPSINDPTTAVQATDQMHDLLRRLATRPFPTGQRLDGDGRLRLLFPVTTWDAYIKLACAELRHYGERSIQVMRRMRSMLEDLLETAPPDRLDAVETELKLVDAAIERAWPDLEDRQWAAVADRQGMGD